MSRKRIARILGVLGVALFVYELTRLGADSGATDARKLDRIQIGEPKEAVESALGGPVAGTEVGDSEPDPPGEQCIFYSVSPQGVIQMDGSSFVRICFKAGKVVSKELHDVK